MKRVIKRKADTIYLCLFNPMNTIARNNIPLNFNNCLLNNLNNTVHSIRIIYFILCLLPILCLFK